MTHAQSGRFDGDSWDPASSVGATATMVAASRALASQGPDPLLDDPLADPLVRAVGLPPFTRLLDGEVSLDDDSGLSRRTRVEQMAVRTRFFDDFFISATEGGIRQAVILASGLDTRAYRLPWPAGTVVYEIDQPQVIDFKTNTLADLGANPTVERRTVSIDLREDWPAALRQHGFDVNQPTAWSAEGLLPYLPPEAQDRLFDNITALSAPGSQLATEHISDPDAFSEESVRRISERWQRAGFDLNAADLFYQGERSIVIDYLTGHDWQVAAHPAPELYQRNGFTFPDDDSWDLASSVGATATMIAAGRAMATRDPRGLINDPFAEPLVRAVGLDFFVKVIDGTVDFSTIGSASPARTEAIINGIAVRTKYFDDYLLAAVNAGVHQVVILASGLDSRAYRLQWPADTVVYEVDQPQVIEFKTTTLADIGARPTAERRTVGIDLRYDWPTALQAAGLDTGAPSAWLAEGLLIYLPSEAQDRLFDNITAMSAPRSTVATEYVPGLKDLDPERVREQTAAFREHLDIDMPSLVYTGERSHVIEYLRANGWDVASTPRAELFNREGFDLPAPEDDEPLGEIIYVSGTLAG